MILRKSNKTMPSRTIASSVNRRPYAEAFVQIKPGNAGSRNSKNPIQNKAMLPRATTAREIAIAQRQARAWLQATDQRHAA